MFYRRNVDRDFRDIERAYQADASRDNWLRLARAHIRTKFAPYIISFDVVHLANISQPPPGFANYRDYFNYGFMVIAPLFFEEIVRSINPQGLSFSTTSEAMRHGLYAQIYSYYQTVSERDAHMTHLRNSLEQVLDMPIRVVTGADFGWDGLSESYDYLQNLVFQSHISDSISNPRIEIFIPEDPSSYHGSSMKIYIPFSWQDSAKAFFDDLFGPWPVELGLGSGARHWEGWNPGAFMDKPKKGWCYQYLSGGPHQLEKVLRTANLLKTIIDEHYECDTEIVMS